MWWPDRKLGENLLIIVFGIGAGILLAEIAVNGGLTAGESSPGDGTKPSQLNNAKNASPSKPTFIYGGGAQNHLFSWAIETGKISTPSDIAFHRADNLQYVIQQIASGEAHIAILPPSLVPQILQRNEDARILPYYLRMPQDFSGVYVRQDSSIHTPTQLKNTTIAMSAVSPTTPLSLLVLREQYDISLKNVTIQSDFFRPRILLARSRVDAAVIDGYFNEEFRRLFSIQEELKIDGVPSGFISVFVVTNTRYTDEARRVISTVNRSSQIGASHVTDVLSYYPRSSSPVFGNVTTLVTKMAAIDGPAVVPMSDRYRRILQEMYNIGRNQGFYTRNVNVSRVVSPVKR